jgi:hypothetical protein
MVVLPYLAAQARTPPPVPPLIDKSEFESDEAYKAYMATRRKAQERLREFNRPPHVLVVFAPPRWRSRQPRRKAVEGRRTASRT